MVVPEHFRHRLLHNQVDLVLAAQLRRRPDVIVARVPMAIGGSTIHPPHEVPDDPPSRPDEPSSRAGTVEP